MRHRLLIVSALAALLVAASVATTQGSHRRGCSIKGASVIVQSKDGRVLATKPRISGELQVRKVYACAFSKGKLIKLGTDKSFQEEQGPAPAQQLIEAIALDEYGGTAVGYSIQRCAAESSNENATCTADVRVKSLRNGKQTAFAEAGSRVWTVVVPGYAYAGFISERPDGTVEVHRLVRDDDKVLDTGTEQQIDVGSLATPLGWRNASSGGGAPSPDIYWKATDGAHVASVKCGFQGEEPCPAP